MIWFIILYEYTRTDAIIVVNHSLLGFPFGHYLQRIP